MACCVHRDGDIHLVSYVGNILMQRTGCLMPSGMISELNMIHSLTVAAPTIITRTVVNSVKPEGLGARGGELDKIHFSVGMVPSNDTTLTLAEC